MIITSDFSILKKKKQQNYIFITFEITKIMRHVQFYIDLRPRNHE